MAELVKAPLHLVEDVESFWRRRPIYHNYNQVAAFFSLPRNVAVDIALEDFKVFRWRNGELCRFPAETLYTGA